MGNIQAHSFTVGSLLEDKDFSETSLGHGYVRFSQGGRDPLIVVNCQFYSCRYIFFLEAVASLGLVVSLSQSVSQSGTFNEIRK